MTFTFPIEGLARRPQAFQAEDESWNVHASCVVLAGVAVMVSGPAGSGKTSLCHDLVAKGAYWVADDRVVIALADGLLTLTAPPALQGLVAKPRGGPVRVTGMMPFEASPENLLWVELVNGVTDARPLRIQFSKMAANCLQMPARPSQTMIANLQQYLADLHHLADLHP